MTDLGIIAEDINYVNDTARSWDLCINASKCTVLHIKSGKKKSIGAPYEHFPPTIWTLIQLSLLSPIRT